VEDDQTADMEDSSGMRCPYCQSTVSCEHLLLSVDVTFREAGSGLLFKAFDDHWHKILELGEDDPKFNEREAFNDLLEEVNSHADSELTLDSDTAPGMSSTFQLYYCSTPELAKLALERFRKAN
jgi:hypothetical protein